MSRPKPCVASELSSMLSLLSVSRVLKFSKDSKRAAIPSWPSMFPLISRYFRFVIYDIDGANVLYWSPERPTERSVKEVSLLSARRGTKPSIERDTKLVFEMPSTFRVGIF
jgi:hypothetical protein